MVSGHPKPHYDFEKFKSECASGQPRVSITYDAKREAREFLNLNTERDIFSFIGNGGLDNRQFQNSAPLRKNLAGNQGRIVDAYTFTAGLKNMYIAIIFNDKRKRWHIKSLKESTSGIGGHSQQSIRGRE